MLTAVPAAPIVGEKALIVGAPVEAVTTKDVALVAEPAGVVTASGPVVAPDGTLTTSCVAVAEVTLAAIPLKVTVFWLAVVLNPVPKSVTELPLDPLLGVNSINEASAEFWRAIERVLPTAS